MSMTVIYGIATAESRHGYLRVVDGQGHEVSITPDTLQEADRLLEAATALHDRLQGKFCPVCRVQESDPTALAPYCGPCGERVQRAIDTARRPLTREEVAQAMGDRPADLPAPAPRPVDSFSAFLADCAADCIGPAVPATTCPACDEPTGNPGGVCDGCRAEVGL